MLRVGVLGELELELDGVPVDLPASRRARSLLGLLALERRPHHRSQLAARFWPDVLDESARTSLRAALAALRRELGPAADDQLIATRESVALSSRASVDAAEFDQHVAAGRAESAVALWRGDILTGLEDGWILIARDEWRAKVCGVLGGLAAGAERDGDLAAALEYARQIVAIDPLAEEGQRLVIRLQAARGDRAAALASYKRYAGRLRTELQVAPSNETRALVDQLRATTPAATAMTATTAPLPAELRSATMTLLFTDVVGSTQMLDTLGDEQAHLLRRAHLALLRDVAMGHGGHEVKNLGDGLMVAFDSSFEAAACAVAIQRAVAYRNQREPGAEMHVRIGLHVGEAIREDGDYFGSAVVVARRLCDRAGGGQILTSQLLPQLIGDRGDFTFRSVGELLLKGFGQSIAACELAWEPARGQSIPLPTELSSDPNPLIGRAAELRILEDALARTGTDGAHVVLVAGEPGIGKTRLVAEFCRRAHDEGVVVMFGRCTEEPLAPYQPFVEALRVYVSSSPPEELLVQLGTHRKTLARLVPELGTGTDTPQSQMRSADEGERYALFDSVSSTLREVALTHQAILVIDDLHWADSNALLLLTHIARATREAPLLVLGTYRDLEVEEDDPLPLALADLRRARLLGSLLLGGLADDEVAALIRESGTNLGEDLVRTVAQRTEGNPFFIEEVIRHLGAGLEWSVPESVKDLLLRRLRALDSATREAIAAAAVIGSEFEVAVLAQVIGRDPGDLLDAMDRALAHSVLVEARDRIGSYAFAHGLIRETIYERLSVARRARLHQRAGQALATVHAGRLDDYAPQLAHHFTQAGDDARSFEYQLRAADAAANVYAAEAAVGHYTAAFEAGTRIGLSAHSDERMRRILSDRAWARNSTGDFDAAIAGYGQALEAARAVGDRCLEATVLNGMGFAEKLADIERAQEHHRAALAIAEELSDVAIQVRSLNRLSLAMSNQLDLAGALKAGERALELAGQGDERDRALAIDALKLAALQLGDLERVEQLTSELAALDRARGDQWYLQWTLLESAFAPIGEARWDLALERLAEALAIGNRTFNPVANPLIHDALGWLHRSHGDYQQALAEARRAVELSAPGGGGPWSAWTRASLGWCLLELGAAEHAVAVLEPAIALAGMRADCVRASGHLAWARTLAGDDDGAAAACELAEQGLAELRVPAGGAFLFGFGAIVDLARHHLAGGRVERSESLLRPLLDAAERSGWYEAAAAASLVLGRCDQARDEPDDARAVLACAVDLAEAHHLPGLEWRARRALANLLSGEEASQLRSASEAIVEQLAASIDDDGLAAGLRSVAVAQS